MQIHELNDFAGTLGSGSYLAIDNGTDTGKISSQGLLAATEARIDNIIAGPAPSAQEIIDARLGADGVTYPSLGDAIRDQFSDVKNAISVFTENSRNIYRLTPTEMGGLKLTENADGSYHVQGTSTTDVTFYSTINDAPNGYYSLRVVTTGTVPSGMKPLVRNVLPGQGSIPITITITGSGTFESIYNTSKITPIRTDLYIPSGLTVNCDLYAVAKVGLPTYDFIPNKTAIDYTNRRNDEVAEENAEFFSDCPITYTNANLILGNGIANGLNKKVGDSLSYDYESNDGFKHYIVDLHTLDDAIEFNTSVLSSRGYNYYYICDGNINILERIPIDRDATGQITIRIKKPSDLNKRWLVFNRDVGNTALYGKNLKLVSAEEYSNPWSGKKIVWYGTSISACGYIGKSNANAIPQKVGYLLNANVINEAIGSSCVHCKVPRRVDVSANPYGFYENFEKVSRCLTNSETEMQWVIDHYNTVGLWNTGTVETMTAELEAQILANSYETKIDTYLTDSTFPDLFVFEHGYNDAWNSKAEQDGYYETYGDDELYSFRSGMDFLIKRILDYNPRAKIVLIGNYTGHGTTTISDGVPAMQKEVQESWNLPMLEQWDRLGWTTVKTIEPLGYWDNSGGAWSWVEDSTPHEMTVLQAWIPDGVHPHTDPTGKAVQKIAEEIAKYLKSEVSIY